MLRPIVNRCTALLALVPALATSVQAQEQAPAPAPLDAAKPAVIDPALAGGLAVAPGDCVPERHGPWQSAWASVGYTRWRISDAPLGIPLATTGDTGVPGDPTTVVLFGGRGLDYGTFNGLRFDAGLWLNDTHTLGVGGGYSAFDRRSITFAADSATGPALIGIPFFDVNAGPAPGVFLVANPDLINNPGEQVVGALNIRSDVKFDSFELHARRNLAAGDGFTADATLGYRYFHLRESLVMRSASAFTGDVPVVPPPPPPAPPTDVTPLVVAGQNVTDLSIEDSFRTRNRIHGVQLGGRAEVARGAFFASAAAKLTLGVNQQRVDISGVTQGTNLFGQVVTAPGGRFAVSGTAPRSDADFDLVPAGNLGRHRYNQFIIMPELALRGGVQLASHVRVFVGYDLLYINDVVRPGSQLDPNINLRLVPSSDVFGQAGNGLVPMLTRARHDFFAHGVSAGIEVQY